MFSPQIACCKPSKSLKTPGDWCDRGQLWSYIVIYIYMHMQLYTHAFIYNSNMYLYASLVGRNCFQPWQKCQVEHFAGGVAKSSSTFPDSKLSTRAAKSLRHQRNECVHWPKSTMSMVKSAILKRTRWMAWFVPSCASFSTLLSAAKQLASS